jgi:hypothetical protein
VAVNTGFFHDEILHPEKNHKIIELRYKRNNNSQSFNGQMGYHYDA